MLNVLFFAQTRELIGVDSIQLEGDFATAEAVREHLAQKGDRWALALEKGKLFEQDVHAPLLLSQNRLQAE